MNLLLRAKFLTLSGILALGSLGVAAPSVHAAPAPQLYPLGGPGEVTIEDNGGFAPGTTVHLELETPDHTRVVAEQYATVSVCGNISTRPNLCSGANYPHLDVSNYVGDVEVWAYQVGQLPVLAHSHVYPLATISAMAIGYRGGPSSAPNCSVYVSGSQFFATTGQMVLVRLFDSNWQQLAWNNATVASDGSIFAILTPQSWRMGDSGHVTADPYLVGQPASTSVTLC